MCGDAGSRREGEKVGEGTVSGRLVRNRATNEPNS